MNVRRLAAAALFVLGLAIPGVSDAQAPPAGSAKAAPAKGSKKAPSPAGSSSAKPTASALPAGHPPVGDQLPAGHPAVGGDLPPGHPGVDDADDDDDAPPPPNPHGGGQPHAAQPGVYEPPPDGVEEDPALPPGTIVAVIRDAEDRPIPRAAVTLGILRNAVAKGESRERIAREADDSGTVRFDGLEASASTSYRISTDRGPATFAVPPFTLSDKAGKRAVLHSFLVAGGLDDVLVGMQGIIYLSLREDSITIENLYAIFNIGPVAWVPTGVSVGMPTGHKAFNKPDSMDDARFDEDGDSATLHGTFPPGRRELHFRYQIPLEGTERQAIHLEMPPRVAEVRVMIESSKQMGLEVAGFPAAQKSANRDGKRILVTQRQVSRAEGGVRTLDITMTGLPTPGPGRWIAVGLGVCAIGLAAYYLLRRQDDDAPIDDDTRSDLVEARRALLDEIMALERAHRSGEVGPKTYARIRKALLDSLARIVGMLEGPAQSRAEPRRREASHLRVPRAEAGPVSFPME